MDVWKSVMNVRKFIESDPDVLLLAGIIEETKKILKVFYPRIKSNEPISVELNNQLSELTQTLTITTEKYRTILKSKFASLADDPKYETIFESILNGSINYDVLYNVLQKVEELNKGKITYAQGFNSGIEYITEKANLPNDFFNRMPEK